MPNYSHYNQPLAHPLGANFTELLLNLSYKPHPKIQLQAQYLHTKVGLNINDPDVGTSNYGQDILTPNSSRISNFGITQNQGLLSTINSIDLRANYKLTHKLYWDMHLQIRKDSNAERILETQYFSTGLRYNIAATRVDY